MNSELHKAVDKRYGKYSNIRVVHPMHTYERGRASGIHVGLVLGFFATMLHDIHFHDWHNFDAWSISLFAVAIPAVIWRAYKSQPNEIAVEIRKSIDIYKDE